jgi:hypothetical protein
MTIQMKFESENAIVKFLQDTSRITYYNICEKLEDYEIDHADYDAHFDIVVRKCAPAIVMDGRLALLQQCVEPDNDTANICENIWRKFIVGIVQNKDRYTKPNEDSDETIMEQWIAALHEDIETFVFGDVQSFIRANTAFSR